MTSAEETNLAPALAHLEEDAVIVGEPGGVIREINAAACGLTGYRPSELVGMSVFDLVAPEWRAFVRKQRRRKIEAQQHLTRYECAYLTKSGLRVPVQVTSTLLFERGEISGIRIVARDMRRLAAVEARLEEAEERFRGAFEGAAIGMAMVAPDGRWLRVNDSLTHLLGYDGDELLDLTFQDVTHPDDLQRDLDAVRDVLAGRISWYHMEKRYIRKDGRVIWGLLAVSLVRGADGAPAYFISQISDITAAKSAERARLEALDGLDRSQPRLSEREGEVVRLLAEGRQTADVAATLGIGEETVQTLVKRAMKKLSARNRTHLVAKALQLGLVTAA